MGSGGGWGGGQIETTVLEQQYKKVKTKKKERNQTGYGAISSAPGTEWKPISSMGHGGFRLHIPSK